MTTNLVESFLLHRARLDAFNRRWRRIAQMGKARFSTCQFFPGAASADDDAKCGAKTENGGPYCRTHRAVCIRPDATKASRLKAA